jgi:hypothetical protein
MNLRFGPTRRGVAGSLPGVDVRLRLANRTAPVKMQLSSSQLAFPRLVRVERDGGVYRRLN